jgi:hypothetical protein
VSWNATQEKALPASARGCQRMPFQRSRGRGVLRISQFGCSGLPTIPDRQHKASINSDRKGEEDQRDLVSILVNETAPEFHLHRVY